MYQMQAAAAELLEHFEFALPEEKMHIRRVPAFLMVLLIEEDLGPAIPLRVFLAQ